MYKSSGDLTLAEEVTNDAMLRVWQHRRRLNPLGSPLPYSMQIAHNLAIDGMRPKKYQASRRNLSLGIEDGEGDVEDLDSATTPEKAVIFNEVHQSLRSALASLPQHQQRAVIMAYLQGFSYSQVAKELGLPLGTVKSRIRNGLSKLRGILENEGVVATDLSPRPWS